MTTVDEQYIFDLSKESNNVIRDEFYRVSVMVDPDGIDIDLESADELVMYYSKLLREMALRGIKLNKRTRSKATSLVSDKMRDIVTSGEITLKYVHGTSIKHCFHCGDKLFPEDELSYVCSNCHGRQPGWYEHNAFIVDNKVGIK